MFQAVRDETISQEDMDYWFTENQDDIIEERFLKPLEEIPNTDFTVRNEDWDSENIDTLRVGDVRTAEIIGIHLYHGAVIDLGTQYHGIIPVNESQWPNLNDTLTLEKQVRVRVHAVRNANFFRFPVQLELLDPDCAAFLTPPNEYEPPMIISPDMDPLEVVKASGRDYEPSTYVQDDPEDAPNRILEKIDFKDKFGPAAEYPLEIRYALGELEGEELEEYEDWLESDEAKIMDVDALFSEEALSSHLLRAECLAGQLEQDTSLDKFY